MGEPKDLKEDLFYIFLYVGISRCVYPHMCAGAYGGHDGVLGPLQLELWQCELLDLGAGKRTLVF